MKVLLLLLAQVSSITAIDLNAILPIFDNAANSKSSGSVSECSWLIFDNSNNGSFPLNSLELEQWHSRFMYSAWPVPYGMSRYHSSAVHFKWETFYSTYMKPTQPFHSRLIRSTTKPFCIVLVIPDQTGQKINYEEV